MNRRTVAVLLVSSVAIGQNAPPSNASINSNQVPSAWGYGSQVTVYIDSADFPQGTPDASAVEQGFNNTASAYSSQGVTFSFVYFNGDNGAPALGSNSVWVTDASFADPNQYGNNSWISNFSGPYGYDVVNTSVITLDLSKLNSVDALTYAVVHESSHDFFLGDCRSGCGDDSVMSYEIDPNDPPFLSPTPTDTSSSSSYGYDDWQPYTPPTDGGPCSWLPSWEPCGVPSE